MKIAIIKYDYKTVDGKLQRTEVPQSNLKSYFKSLLLFCFKTINYKHINAKDHNDKPMIKDIIEIRGLRRCLYDNSWGQRYDAIFMWKFGKYYI
jgi:hypothetical protein